MDTVEIFNTMPSDFKSEMEVVACFCENGPQILLLQRHVLKPYGGTWCLPGGKAKPSDGTAQAAALREVKEETGKIILLSFLTFVHKLYVRYPEMDFVYTVFRTKYFSKNIVLASPEHSHFLWVTPSEALTLPLIPGERENIKLAYQI